MLSAGLSSVGTVPYDEAFRFLTMSSTPKRTAKIQPGLGVKVFYVYYWNEPMREPQWEGKDVQVRYDPEDIGSVYARIGKKWVSRFSAYRSLLNGRSVKALKIATDEIKRNRSKLEKKRPIAAKELAAFLESARGEEVLRLQRRKDLALQQSLAAAGETKKEPVRLLAEPPKIENAPPLTGTLLEANPGEVFGDF